jgi:uncharacterized protein YdeI (YjbR/CyaY-like superfamily)
MPDDLRQALARVPWADTEWGHLAPSARREHVKNVMEAKQAATRQRRIAAIVDALAGRRPTRAAKRRPARSSS